MQFWTKPYALTKMCIILSELYSVRVKSYTLQGVESMPDVFMLKQFIVFEGKLCSVRYVLIRRCQNLRIFSPVQRYE